MKKLIFLSFIFMIICFVCIDAQHNQPKLNQVELSKKLIGVWHEQVDNDTVQGFEMSLYKDAVLETWFRTVKGVKELLGTISFNYDPKLDKFKGFFIIPNGQLTFYYFKFSSDKEIVFEIVDNFDSNKLESQNKFIFADQDHLNGTHYNKENVQYGTSRWVKTGPDGLQTVSIKAATAEVRVPGLNQLELVRKFIGVWLEEGKKDSIQGLEIEQYGNSIIAGDITIIDGKKVTHDKVSMGFSKSEDMFKIFFLFPTGGYATRCGYFTSENRFVQEFVHDFNSENLTGKAEMVFDTPTKMTARFINTNGKIASEAKLIKVK